MTSTTYTNVHSDFDTRIHLHATLHNIFVVERPSDHQIFFMLDTAIHIQLLVCISLGTLTALSLAACICQCQERSIYVHNKCVLNLQLQNSTFNFAITYASNSRLVT